MMLVMVLYSRWLATPFRFTTNNPREVAYNRAHCQARNRIEMLFGFVKNKFRVIKSGIRMKSMTNAAKLVQVIFALWNFILEHEGKPNDIDPGLDVTVRDENESVEEEVTPGNFKTRDRILQKYF